MKICILGATGLLGSALYSESKRRGYATIGCARKGSDINLDISDNNELTKFIISGCFDVVVNTVAIVAHDFCNENPGLAYTVNARPSSILSNLSQKNCFKYVYISTDGYYSGDKNKKHSEESPIIILNEYARTKFVGEIFTLQNPDNLILRTNIVGFSPAKKQTSFLDWVVNMLEDNAHITLFDDYFTSSISTSQFSSIFFDALCLRPSGIVNIASSQVFSKAEFITQLSRAFDLHIKNGMLGSVQELKLGRPESLGLCVNRIEGLVGYKMPTLFETTDLLRIEYDAIRQKNLY